MKKCLCILLFLAWAIPSFAAKTVCSSGCDYTQATFEALSGDKAGEVYYFTDANYTTEIDVNINNATLDGYKTDDTTYMNLSEASGRAKVDTNNSEGCMDMDRQSDLTIQDFEFTDCVGVGAGRGAHGITFKRNYFHTITAGALSIDRGSYNITVGGTSGHGNVFKNIGSTTKDEHIAIHKSHDIIVSYNYFYQNSDNYRIDAIMITGYTPGAESYDILIEYNRMKGYVGSGYTEDGVDIKKGSYNIIIRYNHISHFDDQAGIFVNHGDRLYIYGNYIHDVWDGCVYTDNDRQNDDIFIFSNICHNGDAFGIRIAGTSSEYYVFNNTVAECGLTNPDSNHMNISVEDAVNTGSYVKNNIVYKSRPGKTDYKQCRVEDLSDALVDFDYQRYYWPSQTSKVDWGNAGNKTLSGLQGGSGNGLPQESNGSEGDPGLTDIANNDYTIADGAAVIDAGLDLGSGAIATITIQGTAYSVNWDVGLGDGTDWSGTIPVIEELQRDVHGWDQGAYVYEGAVD
jgi:hypothetical protein